MKDLTVVVLSYNRLSELQVFVPQLLRAAEATGLELIVVDNASTDGSREFLLAQNWSGDARLILNESNIGVAAGRNVGWREASRPLVLNVDDDTRPDTDAMASLVDYMHSHPATGIAFPRVLEPPRESGRFAGDNSSASSDVFGDGLGQPANFHGACHVVRRETFMDVGPLDEQCRYGGEELEYSIRTRARGWSIDYVPRIAVYHHALQRTGNVASWRRLQLVYNYVRIIFMYFPAASATTMAVRVTVKHMILGCSSHGLTFAPRVIVSAFNGARAGRARFTALPRAVAAFYSSPGLSPDFGNVPITWKMRRRLANRLGRVRRRGVPS